MSLNEILNNAVADGVISVEDAHRITATMVDTVLTDEECALMDLLITDEIADTTYDGRLTHICFLP